MILVTTGTILIPFTRLVNLMTLYADTTRTKVIIQSGACNLSIKTNNLWIHPFFSNQQIIRYYKSAHQIVTASGEGSILQILQYAKTQPILFPRLKKYNEHVDNQQSLVATAIKKRNLGKVAYNKTQLFLLLGQKQPKNQQQHKLASTNTKLIQLLEQETS